MPPPTVTSSSFSPDNNPQEPRPSSPTAPPYSPITPTMSASLPVPTGASSSNSTAGAAYNNLYPYPPPSPNSSLYSSPDPLHHAHPQYSYQRQQLSPPQQPQQPPQNVAPEAQQHPYPQNKQRQPYPKTEQMQSLHPTQPINESDNPDAIALRAAMGILQIQRQQALKDLRTLEQQKHTALENPELFFEAVKEGRVKAKSVQGVGPYEDDEDEDGQMDVQSVGKMEIPGSQNVVRAPPINWTQYHVVGESLDKLHEEQRRRPVEGQPISEEELRPKERAPEHVIAKPYDPFVDKLDSRKEGAGGARTRNTTAGGTKKRG